MASIINTGVSALNAFKRQMETTGHNIANVNTEGYSRQRVNLATRLPQTTPQGFIGAGVDVVSIMRSYDEHLATRVRDYNASYTEFDVYHRRASQIDDVVGRMLPSEVCHDPVIELVGGEGGEQCQPGRRS